MKRILPAALFVSFMWTSAPANVYADEVDNLLATIKKVGKKGDGNSAAAKAWTKLTRNGPEVLPQILTAMNDAGPIATNWLRFAVDAVAERAMKQENALPAKELEAFIRNTKNDGEVRRLAFEWLAKIDDSADDRLIPGMLNDPGRELRRDAVAIVIEQGEKFLQNDNKEAAKAAFQKALKYVRDRDQLLLAAARLKTLGVEVDTTKHFGFITDWMVVGPFNSKDGVGYTTTYPPEKGVDLSATYEGKEAKAVKWKYHHSEEEHGTVDFNNLIGDLHGVCGYAYTVVISDRAQPVEIRAASNNAIQIFVNGKKIYGREEYHHGMRMDQHVGKCELQKGRNEVLVKVCQNEQTDAWAQRWSFQLRVCDDIGGRIPLEVQLPSEK